MNDKAKRLMALIQKDVEFLKLPSKIVETYMLEDGTSMHAAIRDCITDLLSFADEKGLDAKTISEGAFQVLKEEKLLKEMEMGCNVYIEVEDDGDTYLTKALPNLSWTERTLIHHNLSEKGITDLRMTLKDYGHDDERVCEAIEKLYLAPLNERIEV